MGFDIINSLSMLFCLLYTFILHKQGLVLVDSTENIY